MDKDILIGYLPLYKEALILTLKIGWQGILLAFVIGLIGSAIVHFRVRVLKSILGVYIEIFRNTPLLVQLFLFILPCQRWAYKSQQKPVVYWDLVF
ncbi:hypothetical protein CIY_11450 [Butyrivibrio fibrisolvens 16/4]|nr:hypothetical protein CIY_11450 [Butyrivibrio fibrisolvens 16/4]